MRLDARKFETKKTEIVEPKVLKELREEFTKIAEISDPVYREYKLSLLEQEAEQYGLSKESYLRLFEAYLQDKKYVSQTPKRWWIPLKTQLSFTGKLFFLALEKGFLVAAALGLFIYAWEAPIRQKQAHYHAWQIINSARGQQGSGGRIEALQDLNKDGVSLNGLTAKGANLSGIQLEKADLKFANIQNATLTCVMQNVTVNKKICSNLQGANLLGANLQGANLLKVNLQGANLEAANLETINLLKANLKAANLLGVNLRGAKLLFANLEEANLLEANLQAAQLQGTNFKKANLFGANLQAANLLEANLQTANLQAANLQFANLKEANLQDANLQFTNLKGANFQAANLTGSDLEGADLEKAKELTPERVKAAKNWDKAHYDVEFRQKLGLPPEAPKKLPTKAKVKSKK